MRHAFKAEFFKAPAHPRRIQVLDELREGSLNVNELRDPLRRARNLVAPKRFGDAIRYEVRDPSIRRLLDSAREIFERQRVSLRSVLEELRSQA